MAITSIYAVKKNLKEKLESILSSELTDENLLISCSGFSPETAYLIFNLTKEVAELFNGKKARTNILAHHLIQTFSPNETTPEQAHEIGKNLANKILKGEYEHMITTHHSKGYIHNNIIFNSVSNTSYKKFKAGLKAYANIKKTSDDICDEYGISVIVNIHHSSRPVN